MISSIFAKNSNLDQVWQRIARIAPGYYSIETLAEAIKVAMDEVSFLPLGYIVNYNSRLGQYDFSNTSQQFWFFFLIYTKETQDFGANIATIPNIIENDHGAWKLLGLMTGRDVLVWVQLIYFQALHLMRQICNMLHSCLSKPL